MADPLKSFFSPALVEKLGRDLTRVDSVFPERSFIRTATTGLSDLELLDRAQHIAAALRKHLPEEYSRAIDVLLRSLGPAHTTDELVGLGMEPFFYLPHVLFVSEHGLGHFDLSMRAQYELTKRFSAEFSIRSYIAKDPERVFRTFRQWARDEDPHVRRLVSEGTRLRLPWAKRVGWLDRNPDRILELLELLKDDPTTMVRRSVANNLNDLGKVHAELLFRTCTNWSKQATPERRALVEHALRSAVKRGEPKALAILGFGSKPSIGIEGVAFRPKRVAIGGKVEVTFELESRSKSRQELLVDLRVHFVKANGKASPKVFKVKRVVLNPAARLRVSTQVSLAVHTTRKPYPGRHAVEVLVNGVAFQAGFFHVVASRVRA